MSENIEAPLQNALHRHLGNETQLLDCKRLSAGASAETYAVNIETATGRQLLILRRSATGQGFGVSVDKHTEALVQQAAVQHDVPAPAVICILDKEDGLGEGYLMQRGVGETLPKRILERPEFETARSRLTAQCAQSLARIHAVPLADLPKLPVLTAQPQLQQIEAMYRNTRLISPVFELAIRWLQQRLPESSGEHHLVHGDFRNGNLLIDEQGLQLVLDWELTHLGDPIEDLGWLCVNAWRFGHRDQPVGGFGQREALIAHYESASSRWVNPEQLRFWEAFGTLKWGVICILQASFHLSGAVRSVERAAIGRRVSETELDLLDLIEGRDT